MKRRNWPRNMKAQQRDKSGCGWSGKVSYSGNTLIP